MKELVETIAKALVDSPDAVSYTHLDVYKRQAVRRRGKNIKRREALSVYFCNYIQCHQQFLFFLYDGISDRNICRYPLRISPWKKDICQCEKTGKYAVVFHCCSYDFRNFIPSGDSFLYRRQPAWRGLYIVTVL